MLPEVLVDAEELSGIQARHNPLGSANPVQQALTGNPNLDRHIADHCYIYIYICLTGISGFRVEALGIMANQMKKNIED